MATKCKTKKEILEIARNLRREGKTIVMYNGSFDILHAGHVRSLEEAKMRGDVLIVGLNSDVSVRAYKGPRRPIVPQAERAELLSGLSAVDYVVLFDEINPKKLIELIKPDVFCNGADWGRNCIEREVVERYGGSVHVLRWKKGRSTTDIIGKIRDLSSNPSIGAIFLDRDGTINENDRGPVFRKEDFRFISGVIPALKRISKTSYKIIIITNQAGIARGYYTRAQVENLHSWLASFLGKKGICVDKIYFCPHAPEDGCLCRKPGIGMLMSAVKDFGVSLNDSWFVGDDERDVAAGREANLKTIKLGAKMAKDRKLEPNFYAKDLDAAVDIILKKTK